MVRLRYPGVYGAALALVRARSVLATPTVMALTAGVLYVFSGSLGIVVATQMPEAPGNVEVVYGVGVVAVLVGLALFLWGDKLRPSYHHVVVAGGTILLTVAIYESSSPVAATALAALYVSVAIDACVFFTWWQAVAHVAFAAASCMVVLAVRPESPWWSGVVAAGATLGVGMVVGLLSRLASDGNVDPLTGLPNRRGFDRALDLEIIRAAREGSRPALVLVNLDRFHAINDTHGHRAGDEVLQTIVESWVPLLGPGDVLARHAGDSFAVLLPGSSEQGAVALTDRMRAMTSMGCSAGVTSWQTGESASLLAGRAEVALYRAKRTGGNRTVLESSRQPSLVAELADAIAAGALDVAYQPIVDLGDGRKVVGVEALVRWDSASRSDVTTADVIRVAEESGLIIDLDRYVLRRACRDAHALQRANGDWLLMVNVNVSGLELLAPGYVSSVDEILRETCWPASQLVLELTESVLDVDTPNSISALHELRARGIRIAVDDFGTGYSSLSRIQTLPTDFLKLDGSFVSAVTPESSTAPLLQAIALLGVALGLPVIAEMVEDEHQAEVLKAMGYSLAQGFHFGRPQSCAAMVETLGGTTAQRV